MPPAADFPEIVARPATLMSAVAVVATNALLLSPMLSDVAAALGSTNVTTAFAISVYGAGVMLSALLIAPRIDRLGALRALDLALPVLGAGLLGSAMAPHVVVLVGAQALAGLSAGIILPACYALATSSGPPAVAARTLSTVLFGWSVAFIGGIPGLTALADQVGWRAAYGALLVVSLAVWCWTRRSSGAPRGSTVLAASALAAGPAGVPAHVPIDAIAGRRPASATWRRVVPLVAAGLCFGTALYGAFTAVADGFRRTSGVSSNLAGGVVDLTIAADPVGWRLFYGAALLGLVIVMWLRIHASNALPATEMATDAGAAADATTAASWRRVAPLVTACLCFASAFYGVFAFFADEVRRVAGLSATLAGVIVLAFGLGFALGRKSGALVARYGLVRLLPLVFVGNAAVYVAMTVAGRHEATVLAVALLWGAMTNATLTMIVLLFAQAEPRRRGRALGLNSATTYLGAMAGTALAGAVYSTIGFGVVLVGAAGLQLCGAAVLWTVLGSGPGATSDSPPARA